MFTSIVTKQVFWRLQELWQQVAEQIGVDLICARQPLLASSEPVWYLILSGELAAMLWGEISSEGELYQTKLVFLPEEIISLCQKLDIEQLQLLQQLHAIYKGSADDPGSGIQGVRGLNPTAIQFQWQAQLFTRILEILPYGQDHLQTQTESSIVPTQWSRVWQDQLKQKQIVQQLKQQISQTTDWLMIVQMTVGQVQRLLNLDRLVIYQLDASIPEVSQPVDAVTYEAKTSDEISSILYFHDETCFRDASSCRDKYRRGFVLTVEDIDCEPNLPQCLQQLMQRLKVRAKIVIPIVIRGELWGFLIAHQCFSTRHWQPEEIRFLHSIAEYLAIAIDQAQTHNCLLQQVKLLDSELQRRSQQLEEAILAAQTASHAKQQFISNVSHEFRTPLTSVIGLASTMLRLTGDKSDSSSIPLPKQQQYLQIIYDSGKRLLSLIEDILQLSSLEAGQSLLNITQFSLRSLANRILQQLQTEASRQNIQLQLELHLNESEDNFWADRDILSEILLHLIGNGIKFTPSGGRVSLSIRREPEQVVLAVADTGIGISPQQQSLLFEKFQQLENYRQRRHGGTGIGLALTQQLIHLHGGTVQVESTPGKGSVFTVYLPSCPPQNRVLQTSVATSEKTIILLEQSETEATLLTELANAAGCRLIWLLDTDNLSQIINITHPAIIMIDQTNTNLELRKIAAKLVHQSDPIKLVLLVETISGVAWQHWRNLGVSDYCLKPIEPRTFIDQINRLCSS